MKIKILRNTTASGQELMKGKVANVSDQDGALLIGMGKAEIAKEKTKKKSDKE